MGSRSFEYRPGNAEPAGRSVWDTGTAGITAEICELSDSTAAQPDAAFALFADFIGGTRLGADRAGAKHRPAERIGAHVARRLLAEADSGATIDRNASDQIIPFAALADGTSSFQIPFITEHTETAGWLAPLYLRAGVRACPRAVGRAGEGVTPSASRQNPAAWSGSSTGISKCTTFDTGAPFTVRAARSRPGVPAGRAEGPGPPRRRYGLRASRSPASWLARWRRRSVSHEAVPHSGSAIAISIAVPVNALVMKSPATWATP